MKVNFLSKKIIAAVLVLAVVFTATAMAFSFSSSATETLNTQIYSISNFTENEMKENFKQWNGASGFVDYSGNTATIQNGILNVSGGTAGNTRYSAHFHKTDSLNQTVSVTFGMDNSNPAAAAVIWLRAGEYYRTNYKDYVPTGYYISCSRYGGYSTVTLHKAHENSSGSYALTQIGQIANNIYSYSDSQKAYLDITIEATAVYDEKADTTVINVFAYKGAYLLYSVAFEDNESELQDAGKVGLAVNNNASLTVPFKSFKYHTTDNSETYGYITEKTAKADGTMVGLYTAIDPTATYELSAYIDASDSIDGTFNSEPLCVMYKGASNVGQKLTFDTTSVKTDAKYKKYTASFSLPSGYVTESGTYTGTNSSKKGMTLVFVGYAMNDSAVNNIKYTNFELRKVNADGSKGGNLLCNGDFKMGTYGWSDDITPRLWQILPAEFDKTSLGQYGRVAFDYGANGYEYWKNFVSPSFIAGRVNNDTKINICDLVAFDQLTTYDIYADMDKNGILDENDELAIKSAILNLEYLLKQGNQKIEEIDTLANKKRNEILTSQSISVNSQDNVFYVSNSGDDSNEGTKNSPWKTLNKVNEAIAAKDKNTKYTICFKRGDTFSGKLSLDSNVTVTAYGSGDKPLFLSYPKNESNPSDWTLIDPQNNIYRYNQKIIDVGSVFFNGGEIYAAKRTPDVLKDSNGNYTYAYGYEALLDMQFICMPDAEVAITLNNNTVADIKGDLYLKCDSGNPGEIFDSIEFNTRQYVISLNAGAKNITIDNIAVKFGGAHGIGGADITNLLVQNCEIAYIGGGIQQYNEKDNGDGTYKYLPVRYGNGVEVHAACDGYTVKDCYIHDIYDTGVTHQTGDNHTAPLVFKDVSYLNNLIENCTYSIEWFAVPGPNEEATMIMDNVRISENILRNAGSGFGVTRTLQETNWNVSAHIMGWSAHKNQLKEGSSFIISNNVFDRTIYAQPSREKRINSSLILAAAGDSKWLPQFIGNTYINYLDNSFCYYEINVPTTKFNANYFTKYSITANMNSVIGDIDGKFYFTK